MDEDMGVVIYLVFETGGGMSQLYSFMMRKWWLLSNRFIAGG